MGNEHLFKVLRLLSRAFAREESKSGQLIVTGDETCLYYYDPLCQQEVKFWKKLGKETPTRLRRTRPSEKMMMVIFRDKYGILLTEYLPRRTTISGSYYVSIIEQLNCGILKKRHSKVSDGVLLLHGNVPVHKCNMVQTAIR